MPDPLAAVIEVNGGDAWGGLDVSSDVSLHHPQNRYNADTVRANPVVTSTEGMPVVRFVPPKFDADRRLCWILI